MTRLGDKDGSAVTAGSLQILVTPDLIRGPWSGPTINAAQSATRGPWMLKRVQHDEVWKRLALRKVAK